MLLSQSIASMMVDCDSVIINRSLPSKTVKKNFILFRNLRRITCGRHRENGAQRDSQAVSLEEYNINRILTDNYS